MNNERFAVPEILFHPSDIGNCNNDDQALGAGVSGIRGSAAHAYFLAPAYAPFFVQNLGVQVKSIMVFYVATYRNPY